ncbi:Fructose-2,6-bisphosphatase [Frankia canadensis]|uniref:Fructose-2,6-bisphosphatase n=1 Tax=Frankia canadensis TaxID=1836972 RepID=A0A2I2KIW3_9ACTN|nr:histidine phosphatase family protein [Frankia canadensis]SNQ45612.1 Fructose-2,6-bisphosphatase [Frankia canadensis]SOU52902.1 Fructose-2,6-bisphosphatase [Frankia canadensis]
MRLLLWRHGRTTWNDIGRFQGHADPPLDDTGRAQVAAVAPLIRAMNPDVVVSSDLQRCRDTAAGLGLPFRADARLREVDLGRWSGLTGAEAAARYPEEDRAWRTGEDIPRGGGETYRDVARRAGELFDEVRAEQASAASTPDPLIVFVLHGGTARALIGRVLGMPPQLWWHFGPLANCRWSLLRLAEGGFRLTEHNAAPLLTGKVGRAGSGLSQALLPSQGAPTESDTEPVHLPK